MGAGPSLAALVAAYDADAGGVRAMQMLAGVTVVEHQARRLAAAGAGRIVLLLEDWPAALAPALQRLRADGIAIDTVTKIADAADRLGTEPRVLLLADGCLPDRALIETMASAVPPSLAIVPDDDVHAIFERIDADARWAGLALVDGRALIDTAAMVGDWDPVSTLLRRAVQQNSARVTAGDAPIMAAAVGALATAESKLLTQSRERPRGWAARYIEAPLTEVLLPRLFARSIAPAGPAIAAAALALLGGGLALFGKPAWGLACILPTGILASIASRLALIQARPLPWPRSLRIARLAGLALGAIGLGETLRRWDHQWGWLLLAVLTIGGLAVIERFRFWFTERNGGEAAEWVATPAAMPWLVVPFVIANRGDVGFALIAAYAIGSATYVGWRATGNGPPPA